MTAIKWWVLQTWQLSTWPKVLIGDRDICNILYRRNNHPCKWCENKMLGNKRLFTALLKISVSQTEALKYIHANYTVQSYLGCCKHALMMPFYPLSWMVCRGHLVIWSSICLSLLCHLRSIAAHRDHLVRRLSIRLSGSHTFLVVTHSYVSQATHAFLGMLPLFCLFVHLYAIQSLALTCIYSAVFKFGWEYSNQTWTVSSSKTCLHFCSVFTDIICPWG